jgi:hypothetical protein
MTLNADFEDFLNKLNHKKNLHSEQKTIRHINFACFRSVAQERNPKSTFSEMMNFQ